MESFQPSSFNPFALITDPQSVFTAIERSERLARLHSRVYRPLDRPLLDSVPRESAEFDNTIEAEPEAASEPESAAGQALETQPMPGLQAVPAFDVGA
jgi:hypothetical protein